MNMELSKDEEVNHFFGQVISILTSECSYPTEDASRLVREYYDFFRDADRCKQIGVPTQDDDFFFHEGIRGMALRVHYYLGLKGDPNPRSFIEWRSTL